jgi:hypothetical protein
MLQWPAEPASAHGSEGITVALVPGCPAYAKVPLEVEQNDA